MIKYFKAYDFVFVHNNYNKIKKKYLILLKILVKKKTYKIYKCKFIFFVHYEIICDITFVNRFLFKII